jgi:integrin alpha FG-GAP repeat containing protein 1
VSYSGASFKFTVLDPTGARRSTQCTFLHAFPSQAHSTDLGPPLLADGQLPQSTYLSLNTPYSYFGLGRTNNYVENLFIGSTRHQPDHYINIEGVIPNSQVLIIPFQPEGTRDPSSWRKELYLHPGDWIPWVTIVLGAAILLLGAVVLGLHITEKVS